MSLCGDGWAGGWVVGGWVVGGWASVAVFQISLGMKLIPTSTRSGISPHSTSDELLIQGQEWVLVKYKNILKNEKM